MNKTRKLLLFDVDNTLTISRGKMTCDMAKLLYELKNTYDLGTVSGSDLPKMMEQIGAASNSFKWLFTENGLVAYCDEELYNKTNMIDRIGEELYQDLVNDCLKMLSEINLPVKRGTFIELRNGLMNVCPIGRSCTQNERDDFEAYDKEHKIREKMCNILRKKYGDKLTFSIGGQISFDVFPVGWDKTYCLQFIEDKYIEIHFFGDKIIKGGNDYEIGMDPRVVPHSVNNYMNTYEILKNSFLL